MPLRIEHVQSRQKTTLEHLKPGAVFEKTVGLVEQPYMLVSASRAVQSALDDLSGDGPTPPKCLLCLGLEDFEVCSMLATERVLETDPSPLLLIADLVTLPAIEN